PADTAEFAAAPNMSPRYVPFPPTDSKGKTSFSFGAFCDIGFLNMVSVRPAVYYSRRSLTVTGKYNESFINPADSTVSYETIIKRGNFTARYLSFPVDVKIRYPGIPMAQPYLLAGLNTEITFGASYHDTLQVTDQYNTMMSWEINPVPDKIFKELSMGLDLGAGVEVPLGLIVPFVEFNYNLGLTNINAHENERATRIRGIQLKAGVKFKT
ncbi:MAG: PorT family protein, partial [Chitinispirillaceae bacterium]|nr:PorT family protein [Chitinispirillaceae bacterium]